jgi:hypothetical protein
VPREYVEMGYVPDGPKQHREIYSDTPARACSKDWIGGLFARAVGSAAGWLAGLRWVMRCVHSTEAEQLERCRRFARCVWRCVLNEWAATAGFLLLRRPTNPGHVCGKPNRKEERREMTGNSHVDSQNAGSVAGRSVFARHACRRAPECLRSSVYLRPQTRSWPCQLVKLRPVQSEPRSPAGLGYVGPAL